MIYCDNLEISQLCQLCQLCQFLFILMPNAYCLLPTLLITKKTNAKNYTKHISA